MRQDDQIFRYCYFLIIPLLLVFHVNLIMKDPLSLRDDVALISAVDSAESLGDYFVKLKKGDLWDIQPVRDLTFYFNLKLHKNFGYGAYHLTNLLLLLAILALARRTLLAMNLSERAVLIAMVLLAAHPVLNSATAWVSNRKHLLSVFFILLYVREHQRGRAGSYKTALWAVLSLLSQPITIFIPPLYLLYKKLLEKKNLLRWDYALLLISTMVLTANQLLYQTNIRFLGRNAADASNSYLGLYVLKLGRIAAQVLFPVSLAIEYDPGNVLSFAGIALTVILVYLFLKYRPERKLTVFSLIAFSSLFPVVKWGPRDAYLIITLLVTTAATATLLEKIPLKRAGLFLVPYFFFLSFNAYKFTRMWEHDLLLHRISYESEGGPDNLFRYANILGQYEPDAAYDLLAEIPEKYPDIVSQLLYARRAEILFINPRLTSEEKLKKFRKNQKPNVFEVFFEAKLLDQLEHKKEAKNAWKALKESLKNPRYEREFKQVMCLNYQMECKDLGISL